MLQLVQSGLGFVCCFKKVPKNSLGSSDTMNYEFRNALHKITGTNFNIYTSVYVRRFPSVMAMQDNWTSKHVSLTSYDCYAGKVCLSMCTNVHFVKHMKGKHIYRSQINHSIFQRNSTFTGIKDVGDL